MGKFTREFKIEDADNLKHKFICKDCSRETSHTIISSYKESGHEDCGRGNTVDWTSQNQIIQCLGCEFVSFRIISSCSEDFYFDDEGEMYYDEKITYYPGRTEGLRAINIYLLPAIVQSIYQETILAIESEQNILAGIGIRALIETICKDQKADGDNLYQQINSLKDKSILTNEGAETLHKLRVLGNHAAHEVKAHNNDQLFLALQIIEHMLDGTYIIPTKVSKVFSEKH